MSKKKKLNGFQLKQQRHQKELHQLENRMMDFNINRTFKDGTDMSWMDNHYRNITGEIPNSKFMDRKEVKWITRFHNLPKELRKKIRLVINHKPITISGCFVNSFTISTYIKEVQLVQGWYSEMRKLNTDRLIKKEEIDDGLWISNYPDGLIPREKEHEDFFEEDNCLDLIWDTNTDILYTPHYFNKYKNTYFDIGCGVDWLNQDEGFTHYWEHKTIEVDSDNQRNIDMVDSEIYVCDTNTIINKPILQPYVLRYVDKCDDDRDKLIGWEKDVVEHQREYFNLGGNRVSNRISNMFN